MSTFYAQINIHNDNLRALIRALFQTFPHALVMTLNTSEEDFHATGLVDHLDLLNELQPFHRELTQDPEYPGVLAWNNTWVFSR